MAAHAVLTLVTNQPGMLLGLSKVLAGHQANITHVDIMERDSAEAQIYLEFVTEQPLTVVLDELRLVPGVRTAEALPSFAKIYGKRIIIMGGGAQVGQVALGAIAEADRHNIRGERISVDTIPLVGEESLAAAVRAVVRLPRVRLLVLAGSLMGGEIARAVEEVREQGLVGLLFEVSMDANKIEIKQAIEALFSVKVVDVHTQIMRGKEKRIGRFMGMRPNWKKAIVTLAAGNKIEFFEGV